MVNNLRYSVLMHCLLHWLGMTAYPWHDHGRCVMRDCKRARGQHWQMKYLRRKTPLKAAWPWAITCGVHWPRLGAGRWET